MAPVDLQCVDEVINLVVKLYEQDTGHQMVRCRDCLNRHKLIANRNHFNSNPRDKFCEANVNGVVLLNAMRNDQALNAWRLCPSFSPEKEA